MATSLARQLQKLKAPQTQILVPSKKGVSVLFDAREAANTSFDEAYQIGIEGLKELEKLDPHFKEFEQLLFSEAAKSLQRAVQSTEVNNKLNIHIRKFLLLLCPYLLLKPALSALEWLVKRFNIGEYNEEDLLLSSLPYHGTRTFVLVLRAVPGLKNPQSPWHWLLPVADTGTPMDTTALHSILFSNLSLLRRLCNFTLNAYKTYPRNEANKLQVLYTFTCAASLGVLTRSCTQASLACVLPLLRTGLSCSTSSLVAGCLAVTAHVVSRASLVQRVADELILQLFNVKVMSLQHEAASVILLIFSTQPRLGCKVILPSAVLTRVSNLTWLPAVLAKITAREEGKYVNGLPLLLPLLTLLLNEVHKLPNENSQHAAELVTSLLETLNLTPSNASAVIRLVFECLPEVAQSEKNPISPEVCNWFKSVCQVLETRYPSSYDTETHKVLSSNSSIAAKLQDILEMQIFQSGKSDSSLTTSRGLVMQLLHPEPSIRVAAVRALGNAFASLSSEDKEWITEAVKERLNDENMDVVYAVLRMPCLEEMLGGRDTIVEVLVNLIEVVPYKQWKIKPLKMALKLLCSSIREDEGEMRQTCLLLIILPPLVMHPSLLQTVTKTSFAKICPLLQSISENIEKGGKEMKNSGKWLFWAALKAMDQVPPEALELVAWRLEHDGTLSGLERVLLCRMLCAAATNLKSNKDALRCCQLLIQIRDTAEKVMPLKPPEYPPLSKSGLIQEAYDTVVSQEGFPTNVMLPVLRALVTRPITSNGKTPQTVLRWCDLRTDNDLTEESYKLSSTLLCLLLELSSMQQGDDISPCAYSLHLLLNNSFPTLQQKLHLFSQLWIHPDTRDADIVRSLNFCKFIIKHSSKHMSKILKITSEATFFPSLLYLLCHERLEIRTAVMDVLREAALCPFSSVGYQSIIVSLVSRDVELLNDSDQLSVVLYSILSPDPEIQNLFVRAKTKMIDCAGKCLVQHCCSPHTPRHVAAVLLRALRHVSSEDILKELAPLGTRLLSQSWSTQQIDLHTWEVLTLLLGRFQDECAASALTQETVWSLLRDAVRSSLTYGEQRISALALSSVCTEVFEKLNPQLKSSLVTLVLSVTDTMHREVSALLRRLSLDVEILEEQLCLLMVPKPAVQSKNLKSTRQVEHNIPVTNSEGWKQGLLLLETLQEKKNLHQAENLIPILFKILKTSLEAGSEQEYCKQLVLGCLSNCVPSCDLTAQITWHLDIELLVQCLRGTTNPQTQHQTLLLLAQTAHTLPEGLLHHLVSVFTFMGSLVMRHDDSYSFHVIAEVIDKLVPVIIMSSQNGNEALVSVLRVFVDAMHDIPSHRRAPTFSRLMHILGWNKLWLFLALVAEAPQEHEEGKARHKNPKIECALELMRTCPLPALLAACTDCITYLSILASIKYGEQKQIINAAETRDKLRQCGAEKLHDPTIRPVGETKRLQATCLSLLTDVLATRKSPEQSEAGYQTEEKNKEGDFYRALMEALMSYLALVTKQEHISKGLGASKFWPAMLSHAYALLNKVNLLLPPRQFLSVVRGVLESTSGEEEVRARALEVLGARLQLRSGAQLSPVETTELLALTPGLKSLALKGISPTSERALFCLRILAFQLSSTSSHTFTPVLVSLVHMLAEQKPETAVVVQANAFLCVAELCANLRALAVQSLPKLVPLVLQYLSKHRVGSDANELVLLGAASTLQKLVETLPNFLSPFLPGVLRELCLLSVATPSHISQHGSAILGARLTAIRNCVGHITLRILLPATSTVLAELRNEASSLPALGPLVNILSISFADLERVQVDAHIAELTAFFVSALELRSDWDAKSKRKQNGDVNPLVKEAEDHVIEALVCLVMKLPETVFRPLYFQLSAWSTDAELSEDHRSRCITFFRCSTSLANSLKSLFVVFAFYFVKQASSLLRRCHSFNEDANEQMLSDEEHTCLLLESVLETLLAVCSHDKQKFVNKECFDVLMQSLVDQLVNMVGGESKLKERCEKLVSPCLGQFARATADEMLWKQLHYQILLKTRHSSPTVRLVAVGAIKSLAAALGDELLPLLPEAVPFLAELLEDEDNEVEVACQDTVRELERILGEPLHKYF